MIPRWLYLPVTCLILLLSSPAGGARNDVTSQVRSLGIPFLQRYKTDKLTYARNIWDIAVFKNKLYLGAGNSSNIGPAPNAGPVPVISFDPDKRSFQSFFSVDEEQINQFFIQDDFLYIAGHDPRENWTYGNIYRTNNGRVWSKSRTIPAGIHAYGLVNYQNLFFLGIGTRKAGSVVISHNQGDTWTNADINSSRIYDLMVVNNKLYAVGSFFSEELIKEFADGGKILPNSVHEYSGFFSFQPRPDLSKPSVFFPNSKLLDDKFTILKISNHIEYNRNCLFIGAKVHNDHQALPFGIYLAESLDKNRLNITQIPIPFNSIPWDIFQEGNTVYVLLDHPDRNPREVSVIASSDLEKWTELFFFQASTFARSFVKINDLFYLSLGGEVSDPFNWKEKEISEHTGQLIAVELK